MNITELVKTKTEREFLREMEAVKNDFDVYVYQSQGGADQINLAFYLRDYKEWLIENKILKPNQ